eukprot:TRINITY_DN8823_c0_g1_i2.p1 TRINITY_DN8823_c0_g1~~TRINITY_DN8823_c0_g1_i2.p1  ORF type:complete len:354 (-),score=72.78 TRINITY_DN8823_c0_g1_i2:99-1160(-)
MRQPQHGTVKPDATEDLRSPDKFVFEVAQEYQKIRSEHSIRKKRVTVESQLIQIQREELNRLKEQVRELEQVKEQLKENDSMKGEHFREIQLQKEELGRANEKMQEIHRIEEERKERERRENDIKELRRTHMRPVLSERFEFDMKNSLDNMNRELSNKTLRLETTTIDQFFYSLSLRFPRIRCISSVVFREGLDYQESVREYYVESAMNLEDGKIDFIMAPRVVNGDHWCLLIFEKGRRMTMFDPKYATQEYDSPPFQHLLALFAVKRPTYNEIKSCMIALQGVNDDHSCGPWICKYAELLANIEQNSDKEKQKPTTKLMKDQKKSVGEYREKIIKDCIESIQGPSSIIKAIV